MKRAAVVGLALVLASLIAVLLSVAIGSGPEAPSSAPSSTSQRVTPDPDPVKTARGGRTSRAGTRRGPTPRVPEVAMVSVLGRVVSEEGEAPIAGADVFVLTNREFDDLPIARTVTDDAGSFGFADVPHGTYRVIARVDGDEPRTGTALATLGEGQPEDRLVIVVGADDASGIAVVGTLLWSDNDEPVAGPFALSLWDNVSSTESRVLGSDGAFRAVVDVEGTYTAMGLRVGETQHDKFRVEIQVARDGAPLVLRTHRSIPAVLRVVDAETGQPLPQSRAYRRRGFRDRFEAGLPGQPDAATAAGAPVTADARGEILLGADRDTTEWWVVAEGYAWTAVVADHAPDTENVARLMPGGDVRIQIEGWAALDGATVNARSSAGVTALRSPGNDGALLVTGLPAEVVTIEVRRGRWFEHGEVYGTAEVTVVAGGSVDLFVPTTPGDVRPRATVRFVVRTAEGWTALPRFLRVEGDEPANANVDDSHRLGGMDAQRRIAVEVADIPSGRYRIEVNPFQWRKAVEIQPGTSTVELDIAAPAELVVSVLDAAGARIPSSELSWHTLIEGQTGWSWEQALANPPGTFRIQSPPGLVYVDVEASGYTAQDLVFEGTSGSRAEHEVRLVRGGTVRVRLLDGDRPLRGLSPTVWVRPDSDTQLGTTSQGRSSTSNEIEFDGVTPGRYEVSVMEADIEGFQPVSPHTVDVTEGETSEVTIELERVE